ncbi:hypothetical protein K1T71_008030 [Dendrolimus kikuchii]|uniref:Uncharacterized protein n=1 Tax=Dendrolimus kikuchii TaxID=765133 RepID=A0ACC1CYR4_9NEOP|nr:hypothetical protein K1T71_008030 [Dendrolimus kikuchii]
MKLFITNGKKNTILWLCLNVLRWVGYLVPDELTAFQKANLSVMLVAVTNCSLDIMVISLIAVCRCRIKLLQLTLGNLFQDIDVDGMRLLSDDDNRKVAERLRACIIKHQAILESGLQIRTCFSYSILAQFTVSIVILCVAAYQVGELESDNKFRVLFMIAYLCSMAMQVFMLCYHGNCLSEESVEIADTLYELPWYVCSLSIRKSLLLMMVRSRRPIELTAGGFATLSLGCFMSIIKVSYSFFTVLQQVEE